MFMIVMPMAVHVVRSVVMMMFKVMWMIMMVFMLVFVMMVIMLVIMIMIIIVFKLCQIIILKCCVNITSHEVTVDIRRCRFIVKIQRPVSAGGLVKQFVSLIDLLKFCCSLYSISPTFYKQL